MRKYKYEMILKYFNGHTEKVVYLTRDELTIASNAAEHNTAIDVVTIIIHSQAIEENPALADLFNQPRL